MIILLSVKRNYLNMSKIKYTFREKKLIKKIYKSPYFWSCDRNGHKNSLVIVSLNDSSGILKYSEIPNQMLIKSINYSVYNSEMNIEKLYDKYEWIKDKNYARSIYENFLLEDKKKKYAVRNDTLYYASKDYCGNITNFEFSHLCTVFLYDVITNELKYSFYENLTKEKMQELRKHYNCEIIKDLNSFQPDGFKWLTDEEAHNFMIEQIYKERVKKSNIEFG